MEISMELAVVYEGLRQELAVNPHWAVRVERVGRPSSSADYHPPCWRNMPTPQAELGGFYGQPGPMRAFVDEQGTFNCAANHNTFEVWWPWHAIQRAAELALEGSMEEHQITVIDLGASPHLKLPMQTLINRDKCVVVKSIPLTLH